MRIEFFGNEDVLLRQALSTYGETAQQRILQEECAELIAAISHLHRKRPEALKEFLEEVADCLIVLAQMYLLYPGQINSFLHEKLKRLDKRLNKTTQTLE